ncbi:uncharacterized protein LOC144103983 [Amblyomma americanum]
MISSTQKGAAPLLAIAFCFTLRPLDLVGAFSTTSGDSVADGSANVAKLRPKGPEEDAVEQSYMEQFAFKSIPAKLDVLRALLAAHPEATRLDTVAGGEAPIYALVVSAHASSRAFLVPRVQLSAAFPAGDGMLVRFAHYLLDRRASDPHLATLLKHTELHLLFHLSGYRSNSFHKVCASDAGSDLVRLLNIDASARQEASASAAYRGSHSNDRLVLSGVLFTDTPTPARKEPDEQKGPKPPDHDVFSHIFSRFTQKQPRQDRGDSCASLGSKTTNETQEPLTKRRRQPTLGALEKHAYAHRGILQSFLTVPCCPNLTKMRVSWPDIRDALLDFVTRPSEGVRGYVKDDRGTLVNHALLTIRGRPVGFWSSDQGEFWRILLPGDYMVVASAPGYLPAAARFDVREGKRWQQPVVVTLHAAPRTFPVLQIPVSVTTYRSKNKTAGGQRPRPKPGSNTGMPSSSTRPKYLLCLFLAPVWAKVT